MGPWFGRNKGPATGAARSDWRRSGRLLSTRGAASVDVTEKFDGSLTVITLPTRQLWRLPMAASQLRVTNAHKTTNQTQRTTCVALSVQALALRRPVERRALARAGSTDERRHRPCTRWLRVSHFVATCPWAAALPCACERAAVPCRTSHGG